jgi:hypothetical protein
LLLLVFTILVGTVPAPSDAWAHEYYATEYYNAGQFAMYSLLLFGIVWVRRALWMSTLLAALLSINVTLYVLSLLGAFPEFRVELLAFVFLGIGFTAFIPHTVTSLMFGSGNRKPKQKAAGNQRPGRSVRLCRRAAR